MLNLLWEVIKHSLWLVIQCLANYVNIDVKLLAIINAKLLAMVNSPLLIWIDYYH